MQKKSQAQWMRDLELSQRNIVFPDTASNEARFWKNVISGKTRFSRTQVVGLAIISLAVLWMLWYLVQSLAASFYGWLLLVAYGLMFLFLRWRVRKALATIEQGPKIHRRGETIADHSIGESS